MATQLHRSLLHCVWITLVLLMLPTCGQQPEPIEPIPILDGPTVPSIPPPTPTPIPTPTLPPDAPTPTPVPIPVDPFISVSVSLTNTTVVPGQLIGLNITANTEFGLGGSPAFVITLNTSEEVVIDTIVLSAAEVGCNPGDLVCTPPNGLIFEIPADAFPGDYVYVVTAFDQRGLFASAQVEFTIEESQ